MLREPTKFGTSSRDHQIATSKGDARRPGTGPAHQQARPVTPIANVSNRLEQLARPKSSNAHSNNQSSNDLRRFVSTKTTTTEGRDRRGAAQRKDGGQTMQAQIFEMRESLANLTQVMETIA